MLVERQAKAKLRVETYVIIKENKILLKFKNKKILKVHLQVNKKTLLDWINKSRTLHLQSVIEEGRPNLLYRYRRAVSSGPKFLTKSSLSAATVNSNRFTVDSTAALCKECRPGLVSHDGLQVYGEHFYNHLFLFPRTPS